MLHRVELLGGGGLRRQQRHHDPDQERERDRDEARVAQGKGRRGVAEQLTWIVGDREISSSAENVPTIMLASAPRVVKRRQNIESSSAGKLALAAIANARPTMKATFWPLNTMPSTIDDAAPSTTVAHARDQQLLAARRPGRSRTTLTQRSCESAAAPDSVRPGDHREDRRERDGGDEAEERRAADAPRRAAAPPCCRPCRPRVIASRPDEHHRAEAEDERDQVEEADEAGRVEHRRARGRARRARCRSASGCAAGRRCRTSARGRARSRRAGSRRACPGASTAGAVHARRPRRRARAG